VVDLLAAACDPGLAAMPSGRFFGFVIGGAQPAALAADWLVKAGNLHSGAFDPSNAGTTEEDVVRSVEALRRAAAD
jgi:hypothetical protein